MRVGLLHLGQSVDFVVSITFLRSPVFAIFAMIRVFLLLGLSLHTSAAADGFNGAVLKPASICKEFAGGGEQHSLTQVYNRVAIRCPWSSYGMG
jgi:hypothetical protein